MNKLLRTLSLVAVAGCLFACGTKNNTGSSEATSKQEPTSQISQDASNQESTSQISQDSSNQEQTSSEESQKPSNYNEEEAQARHSAYVGAEKNVDEVTIQGKVVAIEKYAKATTYNAYLQEGKFGYYVINIPDTESLSLNKSYTITSMSANSSNQSRITAKYDSFTYTEVEDIYTEDIILDKNINPSDSIGVKVHFTCDVSNPTMTTENTANLLPITVDGESYSIVYNSSWVKQDLISEKFNEVSTSKSISVTGILKPNNQVWIHNAEDLVCNK